MASSELLGALNRRREMAEAAGAVFEGSPRASAADTVWDKHHETQFTPKGKHRLPDESRMQRIEQAEEESAGTITPPEEHSPPPGKVRAKESPAEKAARRARVSDFGGPPATEPPENDEAEASPQEAKARSFAEPLLPPVQVQTEAVSEVPAEEALPAGLDVTVACAEGAKVPEDEEAIILTPSAVSTFYMIPKASGGAEVGPMRQNDSDAEGSNASHASSLSSADRPRRVPSNRSAENKTGKGAAGFDSPPSPTSVAKKKGKRPVVKSSEQPGGPLSIDSPLQHFFDARLIMRPESVFKVSSEELLSVVVRELHQRCLGACVVEFEDGRLEFFDCADFNSLLVSALAKSRGAVGDDADEEVEWKATKTLLLKIANLPVRSLVKTPRGTGLCFEPFDSSLPLRELLDRLERQRRVPCFAAGQLRAVVTANDILELCGGCVTKSSKEMLESMTLRSVLSKELSDFELDTTEDTPALEVMQKLLDSSSRAVPVLAQPEAPTPSYRTSGRIRILAQFDLAALWAVFGYKDESEQWWWESEDVTSNIFLHSCVDFLAFGRKNSDGRSQAPVAKVSLDEKLSKVIGRACTSPFRHVVVYEEANDRQLRNPCCEISSHEFVQSLCAAGLLSQLEFNSSKPRPDRFRRMFSSHAGITSDGMSKERFAVGVDLGLGVWECTAELVGLQF
eukprot:s5650_g2.t1